MKQEEMRYCSHSCIRSIRDNSSVRDGKKRCSYLFQVNDPVGLTNWKDYATNLKDADITKELTADAYELIDGDRWLVLLT